VNKISRENDKIWGQGVDGIDYPLEKPVRYEGANMQVTQMNQAKPVETDWKIVQRYGQAFELEPSRLDQRRISANTREPNEKGNRKEPMCPWRTSASCQVVLKLRFPSWERGESDWVCERFKFFLKNGRPHGYRFLQYLLDRLDSIILLPPQDSFLIVVPDFSRMT
jgi:hypothetical protein